MIKNPHSNDPALTSDPSANDILAQQMGLDYTEVEVIDREDLQKKLKDQTKPPKPSKK